MGFLFICRDVPNTRLVLCVAHMLFDDLCCFFPTSLCGLLVFANGATNSPSLYAISIPVSATCLNFLDHPPKQKNTPTPLIHFRSSMELGGYHVLKNKSFIMVIG